MGQHTDPPIELAGQFDPTQNTRVFKVESVNESERKISMEVVYPQSLVTTKVVSLINCPKDDIKITESGGSPKKATLAAVLERAKVAGVGQAMFSGLCSDTTCETIIRECQLIVAKN